MRKVFVIGNRPTALQLDDALVPGIRETTPPSPVRERFAKAPADSIQGCQGQGPHVRAEARGGGAAFLGRPAYL